MGVPTIKTDPMTVEEYFAFTDTRPDEEKWELIDGEPVLNASPSELHQRIIKNLTFALATLERRPGTIWEILPGLGVRVSETSRPEPDVLIIPISGRSADPQGRDRSDIIAAFEILSPSTASRDLRWKRTEAQITGLFKVRDAIGFDLIDAIGVDFNLPAAFRAELPSENDGDGFLMLPGAIDSPLELP